MDMRIREYIERFTSKEPVHFKEVWAEVVEFVVEVAKWNKAGMKEEWGDVMHFGQLWAHWCFGLNGKLWKSSLGSVQKFMDRLTVWQNLYAHVGLDRNVSNFCGNCAKEEKVIKQLGKFGIPPEKASQAFHAIVRKT